MLRCARLVGSCPFVGTPFPAEPPDKPPEFGFKAVSMNTISSVFAETRGFRMHTVFPCSRPGRSRPCLVGMTLLQLRKLLVEPSQFDERAFVVRHRRDDT